MTSTPAAPASAPASASAPAAASHHHRPTPFPRAVGLGLVLAGIIAIVVLAFSWPAVTANPVDLPIAIAGPNEMTAQVEDAIAQSSNGAVKLVEVADRDAAVQAVERREAYGAIILGQAPEVLEASGGSPVVTQMLGGIAGQLQQQAAAAAAAHGAPAPSVTVTDLAPLLPADPRGAGMTAAAFPLTFGGMIGGIAITMAVSGVGRRLAALIAYASGAGLVIAGILQGWFQIIGGDYLLNAAAIGLSLLAMGATIVGVAALVGRIGVLVGPVVFLLIANPMGSAGSPKEFLPQPWGEVGQWFPPGAGATLVRDLTYFPNANPTFSWLVLAAWSTAGLILATIGHFRLAPNLMLTDDEGDDEPGRGPADGLQPTESASHGHGRHAAPLEPGA